MAKEAREHPVWIRWLGIAVGLAVLGFATLFIAQDLKSVTWAEVTAAAGATPAPMLAGAVLALCVSLLAASSFDALALACIGKAQSWGRTALPSTLAFALANAGAPGLAVAGGLRFRAYQDADLGGTQIALVSAIVAGIGLAGGFALVGIGAAGSLGDAAAAAHIPRAFGIVLALAGLKLLASFLLAPRWSLLKTILPSRRVRLGIVLASTIEWLAAATILYLLLPTETRGPLLHFLPLFGLAGLIGAMSGLPAGLGAFDAIVLAVLGPRLGPAPVAAALLLYRAVYVIGPLLAAAIVGATLSVSRRAFAQVQSAWEGIAPPLFAALTFLAGVVMLVSVATPDAGHRLALLSPLAPAGLVDTSHFVASLAAVVLLFLAFGIASRVRRAYLATVGVLLLAALATLLKGLNIEEAAFLAVCAVLLLVSGKAFYRGGGVLGARISPIGAVAIAVALAGAGWLGLFAYQHVEYRDDLWWTVVTDEGAPRFLRASVGVAVLALALLLWRFTRPGPVVQPLPDTATLDRAAAVIATAEDATPDANLALLGDKHLLFSESGESFVQYGMRGSSWVAMGDPVGPRAERGAMIWAFRELCDRHGAAPSFYAVRRDSLGDYIDCGLAASKIGETAVVDTAGFSLEGSHRAALRQAYNRSQREGVSFEVIAPEDFDTVVENLRAVSDAWLGIHHGEEKGFSLGRFDAGYLRRFPTAVLRREGRIVAFANLWRTGRTLSIDLMRYGEGAPKGTMDMLFVHLILYARDQGYGAFELGMAPLSGLDGHRLAPTLTRLGAFVYAEGGGLYGFEGLRTFKEKFAPRWEPVYLAAPGGVLLGRALADAALLSSGGLLGLLK